MQSPSKSSTTPEKEDTPPSSPPQPTTISLAETVPVTPSPNASPAVGRGASEEGGSFIGENVRIPCQVVKPTSGGGSSAGEGGSSAVTMAAAASVVGRLVEKPGVGEGAGSSSNKGKQKRKGSELKDPPSGNPICPECGKEFASWKSVFGHLRIHSNRSYTGLYPPPVSPPRQPLQGDGRDQETSEVRASGDESASATRVFGFDLNKPMEGGSDAEASSNVEKNEDIEEYAEAKFDFDLNQLPADEEDDDTDRKQV